MASPFKKVASHKVRRLPTAQCSRGKRVDFELYSHATDQYRLLDSVSSVAGTPLLSQLHQAPGPQTVDLTQSSDDESMQLETNDTHFDLIHEDRSTSESILQSDGEDTPMGPATECAELTTQSSVEPSPFHTYAQGVLEIFRDAGLNSWDRAEGYVQLIEQLLAQGYYIPLTSLPQVIKAFHELSNKQFVCRIHSLLCQDVHLRPLPSQDILQEVLQETLHSLSQTLYYTPTHLPSRVLLHYIACLQPTFPQLSSSSIHCLLDAAFSAVTVLQEGSLSSPTQILLSLATRFFQPSILIRELSVRIQKLPSSQLKCRMLLYITPPKLRLDVVDHLLSWFYHGDSHSSAHDQSVEKMVENHFQRTPYRPNGEAHELGYFLSLLLMLVQIQLSFSEALPRLHLWVRQLTNRLYKDKVLVDELCTPSVWYQLQLLNAFAQ